MEASRSQVGVETAIVIAEILKMKTMQEARL
jgi:hypothetical protein